MIARLALLAAIGSAHAATITLICDVEADGSGTDTTDGFAMARVRAADGTFTDTQVACTATGAPNTVTVTVGATDSLLLVNRVGLQFTEDTTTAATCTAGRTGQVCTLPAGAVDTTFELTPAGTLDEGYILFDCMGETLTISGNIFVTSTAPSTATDAFSCNPTTGAATAPADVTGSFGTTDFALFGLAVTGTNTEYTVELEAPATVELAFPSMTVGAYTAPAPAGATCAMLDDTCTFNTGAYTGFAASNAVFANARTTTTRSPTDTATVSPSPSPTVTLSPTATRSPSATRSRTATASPTRMPTATATPTPVVPVAPVMPAAPAAPVVGGGGNGNFQCSYECTALSSEPGTGCTSSSSTTLASLCQGQAEVVVITACGSGRTTGSVVCVPRAAAAGALTQASITAVVALFVRAPNPVAAFFGFLGTLRAQGYTFAFGTECVACVATQLSTSGFIICADCSVLTSTAGGAVVTRQGAGVRVIICSAVVNGAEQAACLQAAACAGALENAACFRGGLAIACPVCPVEIETSSSSKKGLLGLLGLLLIIPAVLLLCSSILCCCLLLRKRKRPVPPPVIPTVAPMTSVCEPVVCGGTIGAAPMCSPYGSAYPVM